jgi:hypothetical protein
METSNITNQHLDQLFSEARHEKPVMSLDEARNVIGSATPATSTPLPFGFHVTGTNLIIASGIVLTSLLTYLTLGTGKYSIFTRSNSTELLAQDNSKAVSVQGTNQVVASNNSPSSVGMPSAQNNLTENSNINSTDASQASNAVGGPIASTDNRVMAGVTKINETMTAKIAAGLPHEAVRTINNDNFGKTGSVHENSHGIKQLADFTIGADRFTLMTNGVDFSSLTKNGVIVPKSEYGKYSQGIDAANKYILSMKSSDGKVSDVLVDLDKQVGSDNIAGDIHNYLLELRANELIIDGKTQSHEVFEKYQKIYNQKTHKQIKEGDAYRIIRLNNTLNGKETYAGK